MLNVSTNDTNQQLLQIAKKFIDFFKFRNGDKVFVTLAINKDGDAPKWYGEQHHWPIFYQLADLPDVFVFFDSGKSTPLRRLRRRSRSGINTILNSKKWNKSWYQTIDKLIS